MQERSWRGWVRSSQEGHERSSAECCLSFATGLLDVGLGKGYNCIVQERGMGPIRRALVKFVCWKFVFGALQLSEFCIAKNHYPTQDLFNKTKPSTRHTRARGRC